ncbi:hypothetical protein TNCV_2759711 [Trichonephila clavipes]|nr:hypothetical protein TNCV_2759711 [Trichonephila clavipes]
MHVKSVEAQCPPIGVVVMVSAQVSSRHVTEFQNYEILKSSGRVVAYHASTPQVRGSIPGWTDHLIGTYALAPQRPMATYTGMGTVGPGPHGLLHH